MQLKARVLGVPCPFPMNLPVWPSLWTWCHQLLSTRQEEGVRGEMADLAQEGSRVVVCGSAVSLQSVGRGCRVPDQSDQFLAQTES